MKQIKRQINVSLVRWIRWGCNMSHAPPYLRVHHPLRKECRVPFCIPLFSHSDPCPFFLVVPETWLCAC